MGGSATTTPPHRRKEEEQQALLTTTAASPGRCKQICARCGGKASRWLKLMRLCRTLGHSQRLVFRQSSRGGKPHFCRGTTWLVGRPNARSHVRQDLLREGIRARIELAPRDRNSHVMVSLSEKQQKQFARDGYAVIPDFASPEEVKELIAQADSIVQGVGPVHRTCPFQLFLGATLKLTYRCERQERTSRNYPQCFRLAIRCCCGAVRAGDVL